MNVLSREVNLLICSFHGILMKAVLVKLMISSLITEKRKWIVSELINNHGFEILVFFSDNLFSEFMKKFFLNETPKHPLNLGLD